MYRKHKNTNAEMLDLFRLHFMFHGIQTKDQLLGVSICWFQRTKFGRFGYGRRAFPKYILGRDLGGKNGDVTKEDLNEIAELLY